MKIENDSKKSGELIPSLKVREEIENALKSVDQLAASLREARQVSDEDLVRPITL